MEDLILFDEKKIIAAENIDYIQILRKHQRDDEKNSKAFEDGDLMLLTHPQVP
jgi:hypothetical protein